MKKHSLALVLAFQVLSVALPTARATQEQGLTPNQIEGIRSLIQRAIDKYKAPGATFAIGLADRVVWSEGFGFADLENQVVARPDTVYRTASIGKPMTATAAMKLAEQGRLDLDSPIQRYCPSFPRKPWPITARDLISHTSGIRHYEGPNLQSELFNTRHYDHVSDALELFKNDPLKQRPGDDMIYTTWGYVTLGCVVEGASGVEFRKFIHDVIFEPAGMEHTRDDDPRALVAERARGYIFEDGHLKNSRWVDMSSKMAAGGFITTASDLVRFMNAWMFGRLVAPQTMKMMMEPYRLPRNGGTVDNFGMGWFVDEYRGMRAGFYGGGTPQVSGIILFVPEKRLSVAGIFNLEEIPGADRAALARSIADVVLGFVGNTPPGGIEDR
jgi:CubicO group peptidase (beta-lactamase class C family)